MKQSVETLGERTTDEFCGRSEIIRSTAKKDLFNGKGHFVRIIEKSFFFIEENFSFLQILNRTIRL